MKPLRVGTHVMISGSSTSLPTPSDLIGKTGVVVQVRPYGLYNYEVRLNRGQETEDWKCTFPAQLNEIIPLSLTWRLNLWYKKAMKKLLTRLVRYAGLLSPEMLVLIQTLVHAAGHVLGVGHIETGAGGP